PRAFDRRAQYAREAEGADRAGAAWKRRAERLEYPDNVELGVELLALSDRDAHELFRPRRRTELAHDAGPDVGRLLDAVGHRSHPSSSISVGHPVMASGN